MVNVMRERLIREALYSEDVIGFGKYSEPKERPLDPPEVDFSEPPQEVLDTKIMEKLKDANFMWEAMSCEGVTYPFDTDPCTDEIRRKMMAFDGDLACQIGAYISSGDYDMVGRIVSEQVTEYAREVIHRER